MKKGKIRSQMEVPGSWVKEISQARHWPSMGEGFTIGDDSMGGGENCG